jgi:hypothetical protein
VVSGRASGAARRGRRAGGRRDASFGAERAAGGRGGPLNDAKSDCMYNTNEMRPAPSISQHGGPPAAPQWSPLDVHPAGVFVSWAP